MKNSPLPVAKGVATAVSKHAGFHLQVHTQAQGGKEEERKEELGEKRHIEKVFILLIQILLILAPLRL